MKDKIFGVLQRVGRSFMLPIAILPVAGLLLGIGSSFTNETTITTYGLASILGSGTVLHALLIIMKNVGSAIFDNLPILFAVGVAIGMAKKEKEVAALSAVIAYFVMNIAINGMLVLNEKILPDEEVSSEVLSGTIVSSCGIQTLQMGVFGGIIVGLGVAALHNRFYRIQLPDALSFFGGTRFIPIISTLTYMFVGIVLYFIWPTVQNAIFALGSLVTGSGYIGTLLFGIIKRALIPFGLHHVFYMPFWQTAVGGTMEVAGQTVAGGQNIFFAQLADSANITHFSADATRYFSGEFIFMIFGLPGAALAMFHCAKPNKKKDAGSLLLSAGLACMLTGITEPIEFSFLFVAPFLFVVQVILAGFAYMLAHMFNIAVGLTFSGGLLDLFLFGILQGNEKTDWIKIIPLGIVYFFLYYFAFKFLIKKYHFKTPGREDDEEETKLFTRQDIVVHKVNTGTESEVFARSAMITKGLGGKNNISDIDCCATRLRCTVYDSNLVQNSVLKSTGATGVVHKGKGIQIIYGPNVTIIKSELEDYISRDESENTVEKIDADKQSVDNNPKEKNRLIESITISSPVTGTAADLSTTPDEAFADKMMGDGAVVIPTESVIVAPEDGEIAFIFETKHAIGFMTESGISLLIHVGIDTVNLNGKGFEVFVENGQKVKKGKTMMRIDIDYLGKNATSIATPVVCTELEDNQVIRLIGQGEIHAGEALFAIDIYE